MDNVPAIIDTLRTLVAFDTVSAHPNAPLIEWVAERLAANVDPDAVHTAREGLRRALLDELIGAPAGAFGFLECAPDNWIGVGGV